jgi:N-acetylglucosaminyldiphosphoundecaprenol N-acetyl-beta-D-mannosaminyltransferase
MSTQNTPSIQVLGTKVHMVEIPEIVSRMEHWIENEHGVCHHVVNSGMHGLIAAHRDSELHRIFKTVDLFAPDGILVVWLARLRGFKLRKKNTGPNILWEFARSADEHGYSCYFYGDEEPVLQRLEAKLKSAFPGMKIVGHRSPAFGHSSPEDQAADVAAINQAAPDVLWVGLGMPKQELWISQHRERLQVSVAVGAGAAFKFFSGDVDRGPEWMRNLGFEWLWRLKNEPKRIWRRVLIDAPQFIGLAALELIGVKKFGDDDRH